jgi:hypothetical protein
MSGHASTDETLWMTMVSGGICQVLYVLAYAIRMMATGSGIHEDVFLRGAC